MAYNPIHYPIGDIFAPEGGAILSENNGHRRCPAYQVPESEVPLICSEKEWNVILERERANLGLFVPAYVEDSAPVLCPKRNRDSSFHVGYVRETSAGSWRERRLCSCVSGGSYIRVLKRRIDYETGEELRPYVRVSDCEYDGDRLLYSPEDVRYMCQSGSRGDNMRSVKDSCNRFKWMVRANERFVRLFVTLTYAENMRDTSRLYQDLRRFVQKLRRLAPTYTDSDGRERSVITGYLAACEPQKRGAWHVHLLVLSTVRPSLYISNKQVCKKWGHGFTKTQRVRHVRDVGEYLTAYLSNIKDGKGTKKGARLYLYPVGFRFTRWSRGLVEPEKANFYGDFGDWFRDLSAFSLCFDYQNETRRPGGLKILSRIALFYMEKPK